MKKKQKLKLFVWTNFNPDYTSGLAFAIAKDETDAKKLIEKDYGTNCYNWGNLQVLSLDKRIAFSVGGGS